MMDRWVMAYMFRDGDVYIARRDRLKLAMKHYNDDLVDQNDFQRLEEVMISAYNLAQHIRDDARCVPFKRIFTADVVSAMRNLEDVMNSGKTHNLPHELQQLESVSRSIFNFLQRKNKSKRTM